MSSRATLLAVCVIVAAAVIWRFGWIAGTGPDRGSGQPLASVTVPALEGAAKAGETAYNENCATCHGANAAGQDGVAPPLVHKIYEPSHHGDMSFVMAARNGVRAHHWPFGNMPPIVGVSEDDINNIIAYVRTLQRANGIL